MQPNSNIRDFLSAIQKAERIQKKVFVVLDGARDKRIEPFLNNSALEYACLYEGTIQYSLKRAAPFLVCLDGAQAETEKLLEAFLGLNISLYLLEDEGISLKALKLHLKKLAKVRSLDGNTIVFRYYDPRVINTFLPQCNSEELHKIFGKTLTWFIESDDFNGFFSAFSLDNAAALKVKEKHIEDIVHTASNQIKSSIFSHRITDMIQLRKQHLNAFNKAILDEEFQDVKSDLDEFFYELFPENPVIAGKQVEISTYLRMCFNKAIEYNFTEHSDIIGFISLILQNGWQYWDREDKSWVKEILESPIPADFKLERIERRLSQELIRSMLG